MNWAIIEQVFIMALLAGVGILCRKLKLLDDACTKKLSTVVLNFATPMVILVSYQKPFDPETLNTLLLSFLIATADRAFQLPLFKLCLYGHTADTGRLRYRGCVLPYGVCYDVQSLLVDARRHHDEGR